MEQGQEMDPTAMQVAAPVPQGPVDIQTVGVFLEEIAYFLDDMERDIWWLLRVAHQPEQNAIPIVKGDEELQPLDPFLEGLITSMHGRAEVHAEDHANQVRAKIVIIPQVNQQERALLHGLRNLKFHCKGKIEIFQCMKEANNTAIWLAYFNFISTIEPQWLVRTDGLGQKMLFAQCVVVVPVYIDPSKQEVKLFNVWCHGKKKHWAFPGGDICRGSDRNLFDTARREFHEEVGVFFGRTWSDCFTIELPREADPEFKDPSVCLYVQLEKDGHRYPTRPFFFVQVKEDFYEATRCYEDASGVIELPKPTGEFVRWDEKAQARRVHTEGIGFLEHDEATWTKLDYSTGKIVADDGRQLRKDNTDLFRQQPEKLWRYFADLMGIDPLQRTSALPADFPEDGPFSVRMSSIDKTATDEDITSYFEDNSITVKGVEQFDVPRHTARIDFHDRASLEQALQLSGRPLLRRKVKVELWADGEMATPGISSAVSGARPLKPFEGSLPEEGPFKVMIRGLDKSVTLDDLGYFFWDRECQVKDVDFPVRNERHAGIVEFKDVDSLRSAMGLNRAVFKGREISIDLCTGKEGREAKQSGGGNRSGGGKGGGGRGKGRSDRIDRDGGGGGGHFRAEREPPSRAEFGSERPRLQLQPRSKPLPGDPDYQEEAPTQSQSGQPGQPQKPNPFGDARPREDRFRPTRADGDDNWRR
jgi:8-oxo-dGTP pyrophosphatase MutT (NUDIX family)